MKYWKGYLTAASLGAFTWGLREFAKSHSALVDMVYPYVTRMIQSFLVDWNSSVEYCVWQVLALALLALVVATVVLLVIFKWNTVQWLGWVLAGASMIVFLNFGLFGLNDYAGPLAEDIWLDETQYSITELERATVYYRDLANELAVQVPRDEKGDVVFADFDTLAAQAKNGFHNLVYQKSWSVFAGSTVKVKELGWSGWFTSQGIAGVTVPLTGEAAVNPEAPSVLLPFVMCREMARRMSITIQRDSSFAGYLACKENEDLQFRYSGAMMGYRYCLKALAVLDGVTGENRAVAVSAGETEGLKHDMAVCDAFYGDREMKDAETCELLTSWHIQNIVLPSQIVEEEIFDPLDKTQVDLS